MVETVITADIGETNIFDFDANVVLDASLDKIWFYAKRRYSDSDADAITKCTLNVSGGAGGIQVLDAPAGRFRVVIPALDLDPTDLADDEALLFVCKLYDQSLGWDTTVVRGTMRLRKEVVQAAAV
jgi:hypothetical protein